MTSNLAGIVVGFAVLSLTFAVIEWSFSDRPQKRLRRGFGTDVAYWFFTPLVTRGITRAAIVASVVLVALISGAGASREQIVAFLNDPSRLVRQQPLAVQAVQVLVLGDFIGYWMHRLFHHRFLWPYHAIHHASTELDWLSAVRLHPVNDILARLAQVIPIVLLGYSPGVVAAYAPFLALFAILLHANVSWDFGPFRKVIASPRFHRWHHTSEEEGLDRNFAGLLPLWDVLFGTLYLPEGRSPREFGLKNDAVPEGLLAQLAWPFSARRTQRARASGSVP
jgi:sterol desaturase/sphingolipid hydroxylase (fatty acid hydroxylase superfamily)